MLNDALVEGMRIVGIDFRDGILFVPEVLLAANAMKAGMAILRPLLAETGAESVGKVVIGTVKGDIHDIGKNLVAMMLEGAGFEVIDLGINTDVDEFLAALDEHQPDILGMSALLTTTMPYMKVVIDTLEPRRACATTTSSSSAALRSTRSSVRRSAPTRTAVTPPSRPSRPRRSSPPDAAPPSRPASSVCAVRRAHDRLRGCSSSHAVRCARELLAINELNGLANVTDRVPPCLAAQPTAGDPRTRPRNASAAPAASTSCPTRRLRCRPTADLVDGDVDVRDAGAERFDEILVGYADCGTGGLLDKVCAEEGVEMLAGAHCYQFFATARAVRPAAGPRARHRSTSPTSSPGTSNG